MKILMPNQDEIFVCRCELRIVSDANSFFIETILKHHGVLNCFSKITANPSYVNEEGRLIICPYHDYLKSSHGCNLCPPNMCKAIALPPKSIYL
jgi:pyridoxal phosphate phosphatase PHOSPHO2